MEPALPATLTEAIATEPAWLRAWVALLVVTNLAALAFLVRRVDGRFGFRAEPAVILAAFVGAAVLMDWLYGQFGYVRLLGLGHIVFWGPAWVWLVGRRAAIGTGSVFGKYVHAYLLVAGASLVIDVIDVVRHLVGDGELLHRWS